MKKLLAFLNNMDARAWRTVWVSLALLGGVGAIMVLGKTGVIGLPEHLDDFLIELRTGPWGLPATILLFCATAYILAPQFVLIAAAVAAFGPVDGFFYSWIGTILSGVLTFYTGRFAGAESGGLDQGALGNGLQRGSGRSRT